MSRRIKDTAIVRLVIDGVMLSTTAKLLRYGGGSNIVHTAFCDLEREHIATGIIGRLAGYHDNYLGRTVQIQIDL